jgi:beta-N-acetylhexosaminidase
MRGYFLKIRNSFWRVGLVLVLLSTSLISTPASAKPLSSAESVLQTMTPEEKVGQLFLVGFEGATLEEDSPIYDLIANYHIGGVVLLAENNNFASEDTLLQAQTLVTALQELEWNVTEQDSNVDDGGTMTNPVYVPLLVGTAQGGNGAPGDQLLDEVTQTASQMAIGATWDLSLASQEGEVLGSELSTLGFNLFLGPNLDVLESTSGEAAQYLGVNTFGGDPFWVGEMGKAYISGIHSGSENRMLVIAQNFPGTGNSDRSPEEEVATVRKSLEQLKQIELAPFFSVTGLASGDPSRVDGLMVSHIRYQGFQGNIRATTKPLSFDANALQTIMALTSLETWRSEGGLIISDNLGSGAVRRFFDPTGESFDAIQVARNAFLAGNDMLYVNDLIDSSYSDAYTTLVSTLDFFTTKYQEDSAFAQRIDNSVLRILEAKLGLYGEFEFNNVILPDADLASIGQGQSVTFDVAQNAVTMISPGVSEFDSILPSPPQWYEDIIIFTDVRSAYQCDNCPPLNVLNTDSLANSLVNLYGPQAGGQILQNNLTSYTLTQLADMVDNVESGTNEYLSTNLHNADWVIFNLLDVNSDYPASDILQWILEDRADLLNGKNVIVFSLDSPVYLDATNISKITAYYALYSKLPGFIDVAARVLMQEITPQGALPISLSAVGYDLITMTSPDPDQVIRLELVIPEAEQQEETTEVTPGSTQTPEPTPMPSFSVGDTITIRTGTIQDHNGHIVPDGTVVRFNFTISGEPGITQQFETTTSAGIAYFNYRIEAAGGLEVSATSEPAIQSETLNINIEPDGSSTVILTSPTPLATPTSTEAPTSTPTESLDEETMEQSERNSYPTLGEWALGIIVLSLGSVLAFFGGRLWWKTTRWGVRSMMLALIGGLVSYSYLNLGISGTRFWILQSGTTFVVEMVVAGMLLGWICALIWWMRTEGRYPKRFKK